MAAIDKMYLADYYVFDDFRLWCIVHNPKLLYHFYHWNISEKEWNAWKEDCYNSLKERLEENNDHFKDVDTYWQYLLESFGPDSSFNKEDLQETVDYHHKLWNDIQDKEKWIENHKIPVTNFSCKEDEYLLWHCPIKEIRQEYLVKWCGYKDHWFYKLFFKK